jgi:hypothetical protein
MSQILCNTGVSCAYAGFENPKYNTREYYITWKEKVNIVIFLTAIPNLKKERKCGKVLA